MEELSFEKAMERLDEIVRLLEKNELPMEESLKLFEEGLKLAKKCNSELKDFEEKANTLLEEFEKDA
ncbi:MAG: exodeoxyribonuclease VII small subunit [Erysipelotrichaceae bacterium]|nr:exodeoxyribonuclease VII small subunit [Erysipelotrichaceae bacterium]